MQGSAVLVPKHWQQHLLLSQQVSASDGTSSVSASPSAHGAVSGQREFKYFWPSGLQQEWRHGLVLPS